MVINVIIDLVVTRCLAWPCEWQGICESIHYASVFSSAGIWKMCNNKNHTFFGTWEFNTEPMKSYWQKWIMIRLVHPEQNAFWSHRNAQAENTVFCIKPSYTNPSASFNISTIESIN